MRPDVATPEPEPEPAKSAPPPRPVVPERVLSPEEEAERDAGIARFMAIYEDYKRANAAEEERRRGPDRGEAWEPPSPLAETLSKQMDALESNGEV